MFQQHVDGKVKFVFKQVAVVENFFDIIYRYKDYTSIHVPVHLLHNYIYYDYSRFFILFTHNIIILTLIFPSLHIESVHYWVNSS